MSGNQTVCRLPLAWQRHSTNDSYDRNHCGDRDAHHTLANNPPRRDARREPRTPAAPPVHDSWSAGSSRSARLVLQGGASRWREYTPGSPTQPAFNFSPWRCKGISDHLSPDGQRYSRPESKSIAGDRALFGEGCPHSMRINPLKRPEWPPCGAPCPPGHRTPGRGGMLGPVAEPFWPSGDQACWRGKPSPNWSRTSW